MNAFYRSRKKESDYVSAAAGDGRKGIGKMKSRGKRVMAVMLAFIMMLNPVPVLPGNLMEVQAAEPEFTLSEFHMTDSDWATESGTGNVTEINRQPSVSMKWTTTGLSEPAENQWYDAELFVAPYSKSTVQSSLNALAELNSWPMDDPRRSRIEGQGNNYWQASVSKTCMSTTSGNFTNVMGGNFASLRDAAIQVGDTCTWQLLIYKRTKVNDENTESEVVLQTDMTETTVDWGAGLPYMNEDHMEIAFQFGQDDYLAPTSNVSYEAEIFVWPQDGIADPYEFSYGWVNTVRWSETTDFNVLMQHGAWSDCLLKKDGVSAWFCNDEEMQNRLGEGNSLTPQPGATYTTGVLIHKIDRSSGSMVVTEYRRSPAVEFTVTAGTGGGSGMGPGENSMPKTGTSRWKAVMMPLIDNVSILEYPTGNTGEIKMGVTFHFPNLPDGLKIEDVPNFNGMSVDIRGTHTSGETKKTGLLRPEEARVTSNPSSGIEAISDYWEWAYLSDGKCYTIKTIDLIAEGSLNYDDSTGESWASGVCAGDTVAVCMNANGIIRDEGGNYAGSYATPDSTAAKFTVSDSIKDQSFTPGGSSSFQIDPESVYVSMGTYQDDAREFNVNIDPDNPSLQEFTGGKWAVAVVQMDKDPDLLYHIFPMKESMLKVATGTPGYVTYAKDQYNRTNWQWCNSKGEILNPANPWFGYNTSIDSSTGQIPVSVYQFLTSAASPEEEMKGFYGDEDLIVGIQAYVKSNSNCYSNLITVRVPLNESSKTKTFRPTDVDQPDDPGPTPVEVTQPSIGYSTRTMKSNELSDLVVSKADGSFTFDSLKCGDATLTKNTDYTFSKGSVTIKKAYLTGLGAGEHTFIFHYTGTAGEEQTAPIDPTLRLTIIQMCTATLTVKGKDGSTLSENQYSVVWKNKANGRIVDTPISVTPGTTLTYTITPAASLKVDGVQYYKETTGEVTFKKDQPDVPLEVSLGQQGTFTLSPKDAGTPLDDGYTVTWYDTNGYWKGTGLTSPLVDAGKKLKYEIRMTSDANRERYNDVLRTVTETAAVFGNSNVDVAVIRKTSVVLTVSENNELPGLTGKDYNVIWYSCTETTENGETKRTLTRYGVGAELKNVDVDKLYYEILPKDHDDVHNWIRFYPVPARLETAENGIVTVSGTMVPLTAGEENRVVASVEAVKKVSLSVNVTNGSGFTLNVTGSQSPWDGYSLQPNTSWYRKNGGLEFTLTPSANNTYTGEVYDFDASVKVMEPNDYGYPAGNYETAYRTVNRKSAPNGKDMAAEVTLIPAALPESIGISVTRKTPEFDVGWHDENGEEVYGAYGVVRENDAYYYEEAAYFKWSLYNVTNSAPVPETDYTVEYSRAGTRVKFNGEKIVSSNSVSVGNLLRLTLSVSQGSVKNIHADIPETMTSMVTVKKYWTREDYNTGSYRFHFEYDTWGRVSLETQADSSFYETYGIYDTTPSGNLVASGRKANWWRGASEELAPGTYTVCIWKEAKWISTAPNTLEELERLLNEGEFQKREVTIANGQCVKPAPAFGICPAVPDRTLFTGDSGFAQELTVASGGEEAQFRLNYTVHDSIKEANPDGLYAIHVNISDRVPSYSLKLETGHNEHNLEQYDKNINLYVDDELDTENKVRLEYYSYNGLSANPKGFILFTKQTSGTIYFSVTGEMDDNATYSFNADGWLCGDKNTWSDWYKSYHSKAQGSIGRSLYRVIPNANCSIYFASDYLRTVDNGPGNGTDYTNCMWVYASPNSHVDLYMDDEKIDEKDCGSNGLAYFTVKMDNSMKAGFPEGWALAGDHTIYAVTTLKDGREAKSQTFKRECLQKGSEIKPAVLSKLEVISNAHAARLNKLFEFQGYGSGTSTRYNGIWSGYDVEKKDTLTYDFTAYVENADWVDGDLVLWVTANGDETYRIPLKRDGDTNMYKGHMEEGLVLWSMWEVTITSKKPAETGAAVDDTTLTALGKDAANVTGKDVMEAALNGEKLINPYTGDLQTMTEYDKWIESDILGTNGLDLHTDAEIETERRVSEDGAKAMVKENIEKLSSMILEDANTEMEMTESFFKNMAAITGSPLPEDLVFDGSLASIQRIREYMGINVYYPLAVQETDDANTRSVKNELLKYLDMSEEEQQQYGTIETALDGTKIRRFQRIMIETSEKDHKPHLYSLYITIYTDFPDGLLSDWAEVDVVDGGVSEITDLADKGVDLFTYMEGLTADDFSGGIEAVAGDDMPEPVGYRPGEEPGNWEAKIQSFTEIAVFTETKVSEIEQLNAAMRQNNKNMNGGNQTNLQNQYWQQMKYWKQENNIRAADAGTAEGSALTNLAANIGDMIEQGRKSGKLNEEQIKELTAMKQKVQEINDALTLNIAYEAGKSEVAIYEEIQSTVDLVKNAGKAVQEADLGDLMNGYDSLKGFVKDTAKDYAMDKGKETLYDTVDKSNVEIHKYNPLYYKDKACAWVAETLFGQYAEGAMDNVEESYKQQDQFLKEVAKLGLDPSRFIKEKADKWTREKFEEYENDLNNITDILNNKYGLSKVRVKGSKNTSRNTNAGRARAGLDPSGIVYEAVLSNPVAGATATLYEKTGSNPEGVSWNAAEAGQFNPQVTGADGRYQWFVPEGEWQVRVTHPADRPDLSDNTSAGHPNANLDDGSTPGWLPVLPVQLGIHIPLSSNKVPEIRGTKIYRAVAKLEFSLYMDVSTLSDNEVYIVSDGVNIIPCDISFPDEEASPADASKHYARTLLLTPAAGSGFVPGRRYSVSANINALAYNGKPLAKDYKSGMIPVSFETYTVSFNLMGQGEGVASQRVIAGETVQKPADPKAEGWIFDGWFTDPACSRAYDFTLPVTESFTLYAGWTRIITYTVTFDLNGREGTPPAPQTVGDKGRAVMPADPVSDGYLFTGWYTEAACTTQYDFALPVNGNFTLYAGWKEDPDFTVSFTGLTDDPYYGLSYNAAKKRYEVVYTGSAIRPSVRVKGSGRVLTEDVDYKVTYKNNLKAGGDAKVIVTGKGNYSDRTELPFTILEADLSQAKQKGLLTLPETLLVQSGKKIAPVIFYGEYQLKATDYELSDKSVIRKNTEVDISGKGNFSGTLKKVPVRVLTGKEVQASTIKVKLNAQTHIYNGTAQMLDAKEFTVTAGTSKTPLEKDKDYTMIYANNTEAGTARVIVTAKGDYLGTVKKTFRIKPDKTSVIKAELSSPNEKILFNAKGAAPDVTVSIVRNGQTVLLRNGVDYKVTYANNKRAGDASYTVRFKGSYSGHAAILRQGFKILPAPFAPTLDVPEQIYKRPGKYRSAPYVSIDGAVLNKKNYTVKYFDGDKELTARDNITLEDDETEKEITIQVTGKGNYEDKTVSGSYRVVRTVTDQILLSKAKIVSAEDEKKAVPKQAYTGKEIRPEISVLIKQGREWVKIDPADYEVIYLNNIERGQGTILIKGKGTKTAGNKTASFSIKVQSMKTFQ